MERPGNYYKIYHQRFFDPCKVRAAVFGERGKRGALVGVDALMVPRDLVQGARRAIERSLRHRARRGNDLGVALSFLGAGRDGSAGRV